MDTFRPAGITKKYFTVEEANRTLPLVKSVVRDIVEQLKVVNELRGRLEGITSAAANRPRDVYAEELAQSEAAKEAEESKLESYFEELSNLGVEFKGPDGLCDFPAIVDGREVYLCWRLGEPEVAHWHEIEAGFAGRRPLPPAARAN